MLVCESSKLWKNHANDVKNHLYARHVTVQEHGGIPFCMESATPVKRQAGEEETGEKETREPTPKRQAPDQGRATQGRKGRKETRGGASAEGRPLFVRSEATYEQRVPRGARGNGWEGGGASPAPSRYSVTHHGLLGAGLPSANPSVSVDRRGLLGARKPGRRRSILLKQSRTQHIGVQPRLGGQARRNAPDLQSHRLAVPAARENSVRGKPGEERAEKKGGGRRPHWDYLTWCMTI